MIKGLAQSRTWQLLNMLADGKFHSGEALAQRLGVSRASVFNALSGVGVHDVALHRIRGRGYKLARPWQCLERDEVMRWLGKEAGRFNIDILPQAVSSNTLLLQRAKSDVVGGIVKSGSVLAVELQTSGRGRMGRAWHSGLGSSLTFSLLWRFQCGLNTLSGLSLAVGVAHVRALNRLGAQGVRLKWPNDVMTNHGKLGGVLIEAQGDMLGPSTVVIGIGLNYSMPAEVMKRIDQPACALDEVCNPMPTRNQLLAIMLLELADVLREFEQGGFALLRKEWERYHIHQDCKIHLNMQDGRRVSGKVRGVNDSGELCLDTSRGVRYFNSGQIGGIAR